MSMISLCRPSLPCLKRVASLALVALLLAAPLSQARERSSATPVALQREAERLAGQLRGSVGAAAIHVESGRSVFVDGDRAFPMASTMKLPVAVHILKQVDEGTLSLTQQVLLAPGDVYPQMGGPMDLHLTPGSAITVRDLLHMMITVSDNNATDLLLRLGGGTAAVDARMRALGIDGIRVDRYIWELLANYYGDAVASQATPLDAEGYGALAASDRDADERRRNMDAYNADPRDTATARAMATLLARLWRGELLSADSTQLLQAIMQATRTGGDRLRGALPPHTPVAHKTGTVGDMVNDVGVITLPDGRGHVVVVAFVQSDAPAATRAGTIAQLARAAHDYFLFVP
ncbi:class A beta-lactamase [Luteimonas aestuarii]